MAVINIIKNSENPHESANGIRIDTVSRGVDLEGSTITATYTDGTTETLTWQARDPYTFGGVSGTNINMSYGYEWHELKTTKALISLQIDLQPAYSVFDINFDNDDYPTGQSTPGSLIGSSFTVAPEYEDSIGELTVTYSGIVNVAGSTAVGDLYTTMIVDFSKLPAGGLLGDLRWGSDIDTMRDAGDLVPLPSGVSCFVRGTLITTDQGDVPVESLKPGHKVLTQDNGFQELIIVMSRIIGTDELRKNEKLYPLKIAAGTLGLGLPKRNLNVSRQHRMIVKSNIVSCMFGTDTSLVAAIRLANLPGVFIDKSFASVEYFHLAFKQHEIVFAEGAPAESFLASFEAKNTLSRKQWEEFRVIFPEICEFDYVANPAHIIPSRLQQKELIHRHVRSSTSILSF